VDEASAAAPRRVPTIGLAGAIGAGKSAVARILGEAGCVVADADAAVREALAEPPVRETLRSWWGDRAIGADGEVDRRAVAAIVFADPAERHRLESLLHPLVARRRAALFAAAGEVPARVIDAPLLLEAGLDRECDLVVFVDAPREIRLARLRATRGWDEAELERRERAQWPLDRKRARADHVLRNDADLASLRMGVLAMLEKVRGGRGIRPSGT
jgi:dephospho-CoA kinase